MNPGELTIAGAGLCGSLLGILLRRRGHRVTILERRSDPRTSTDEGGRSINLALSARGIRALQAAGIFSQAERLLMPMRGRLIHYEDGKTELLPYGQRNEEQIYSVSRAALNRLLIDAADYGQQSAVRFRQDVSGFDRGRHELRVVDLDQDRHWSSQTLPVIAADGAGSAIRRSLQQGSAIEVTESLLPHGYKELSIPPAADGRPQLDPQALHIWPRGQFMLIALPNPGGDFTLTLFMPNEGPDSFAVLDGAAATEAFFSNNFPDLVPLIPGLVRAFLNNPVGILGTVRCGQWHDGGELLLIGDAAHAIVPFHGQGMNLAFEDCLLLDRILRDATSWHGAFAAFQSQQMDNANAIADMALENYVEMRDTVRDEKFKLRKALSFQLERCLPGRFIPRYSMVMFHDEIPYAVAKRRGALQEALLQELTLTAHSIEDIDLERAACLVRERLPPLDSDLQH
ncbi:MAG: NAD(P)/FAD-dependent oxidoreductase [Woeseia sp.]